MGFFSSNTTSSNPLEEAMEEGLRRPYQFTSERECIDDTMRFLDAFTSQDVNGLRENMICHAASSVAGIRNQEIRNCFMNILRRCTLLSPNECLTFTENEKRFLRNVI